eukprot:GGOE01055537.1.p1 GENE.GGOE01055537.1~~GGOE01055537.1.p1  ORF type:complete len:194 (+),score=12.74 GGOE01055537.1:156-737(+)
MCFCTRRRRTATEEKEFWADFYATNICTTIVCTTCQLCSSSLCSTNWFCCSTTGVTKSSSSIILFYGFSRSVDGQICTKPPYVHIFRTVEPAPSMRGAPLPMVRQSCNQQVQSLQVKSLNIQVTTPHNRFSSLCPLLLSRLFQCQTSKYRTHTLVRSPISHSHLHTSQAWDTVEDGWGLCGLGLLCHSALVLG